MNFDGWKVELLYDIGVLILPASSIVFHFSHSVERLELAIANPHPNILNFASRMVSRCTFI